MRRISQISIAAPIRDLMDVTRSDASKLRIGDVVHGAQRPPFAARDRRQRVSLNTLLPRSCAPETSEAAVLVWFWLRPWQRPCLVPFRGGETATAAPMYQNYTLASRPQTSRVRAWGRAFARHLLRCDLADRRVRKKEVWNVI